MAEISDDDLMTRPIGQGESSHADAMSDDDLMSKPLGADPGSAVSGYVAAGGRSTWGDIPPAIAAGAHQVAADVGGLAAATSRTPESTGYWQDYIARQQAAQQSSESEMTPAAQQPGFFSHPLTSTAEAAPGLAAVIGPTALSGPFAPLVGAGLMAGQATGQTYDQMLDQAMKSGMSKEEADAKIKASGALQGSAALGAATGLFPEISGMLKITTSPLVDAALAGGADAMGFGASAAGSEYTTQKGEQQMGTRQALDLETIKGAGLEGIKQGLGFGTLHFLRGHGGDGPKDIPVTPRDLNQAPGEARVARDPTSRDGKKPDADVPGATVDDVPPENKVPPPAPNPVGPDQKVALSPEATSKEVTPPPAPEVTPRVTEPPPAEVAAAAPEPAAPTPKPQENVAQVQREPDATLVEQHEALTDRSNPRDAMVYPPDVTPLDLPNKKAYGTTALDDGRTVQFYKYGPNKLYNADKVKFAEQQGNLNELLGLGPTTKDEAIARVAAGEPGVGVTERTPEGVEVKAAAGTPTTVPDQMAALEASKTPGNTVQVEHPDTVVNDRIERTAQEQAAPPEPLVTPESKPLLPVEQPGRVLPYEAPEVRQSYADRLRDKEAAKREVAAAAVEPKRVHTAKATQAKLASDNVAAQKIAASHPFQELGHDWPNQIYKRAKAMVSDAKAAGIDIPKTFAEGHAYHPAMLKLREAADLIRKKTPTNDEYGRFIDRERLIDSGKHDEAHAARRNEGALGLGSPEGAVETGRIDDTEKPEDIKEAASEPEIVHEAPAEHTSSTEHEANDNQPTRERPAVVQEAKEGQHYTAAKSVAGFQVAKVKNRSIKRQDLITDEAGNPTDIKPNRTTTIKEALAEHFDPKRYSQELRPMMERLHDAIVRIVGDTKAHYISHEDMLKLGETARGVYDPNADHVLLNADKMTHDTALHEAFHAATAKALEKDPELRGLMDRLQKEMGVKGDSEEFLTRLMTDDKLQNQFKSAKISPELARDIGIPKWRKATMWEGALNLIRKALGLGPRDVSAIEAAMGVSEKAMWKRDPGMAMEAGARSIGLKFQKIEEEGREGGFYRTPKDMASAVGNMHLSAIKGIGKELATNAAPKFIKGHLKWLAGNNVESFHGHLFKDAKGSIIKTINYAREKVSNTYNHLRNDDLDLRNRAYLTDKKYADRMGDYSNLVGQSVRYNIHADREPPKPTAQMKNVQRDANWERAHDLYNTLPKALQERYVEEKDYYAETQKTAAKSILDNTLPLFDAPKGSTLEEVMARARDGKLTDDDWAHYEHEGAEPYLRKATQLMGKKDVYFNSQRQGDYVVSGRYEMPDGGSETDYSGELLPDHTREFDTKQEAMDYAAKTDLPAKLTSKNYAEDPNNPGKYLPHIETDDGRKLAVAKDDADATKYRVQLERQHTEFARSKAEADRNRAAMDTAGVKELTGVMDRRNDSTWGRINSSQQKALERRISGNKNMTDLQRQDLQDMTRQMMLAGQNSYSPHMMQRRKVFGADYSTAEGLDAYSRQINQMAARNAHRAELDEGLTRMDNHVKAMSTEDPDNAYRRSTVANNMNSRVHSDTLPNSVSPMMHKIMTYAFTNFLVRPSHILLQQLHPYIYSIPHIGARYGVWKSFKGQQQAMQDLGGRGHNLMEGLRASGNVMKSLREGDIDKAVDLAHGADPTARMIANLKSADERSAMQSLLETGHLHSSFDASVFAGGGMDRWNSIMKQFTDAMEANNRLSTALNAYRLEKAEHGREAGLDYARNMIEHTQGVYSQSNMAPIYKNPLMKVAMQFRQQPANLFIMLTKDAMDAAKGNPEAKRMLAYQLATVGAIGGMSGMPTFPLKAAGLVGTALGGPTPADYQDEVHRKLVDTIGNTATDVIENGLPALAGPYGVSLGPRAGLNPDFLFGDPKSGSTSDMLSYLGGNVIGASGSLFKDGLDGLADFEQGEYGRAAEKFLPGSIRDIFRASRAANEGVTAGGKTIKEGSFAAALTHALGFSNLEEIEAQEGHYALQRAIQKQNKEEKLNKGDQLKAKHAAKKSVLGVPVNKKNQALATEYGNAYQ